MLLFLGDLLFLGKLVLVLSKIHDPADRRPTRRRDFNQVKTEFAGAVERFAGRDDPNLFPTSTDQADWGYSDTVIDPNVLTGDRILLGYTLPDCSSPLVAISRVNMAIAASTVWVP
jgi:hypothetical protein